MKLQCAMGGRGGVVALSAGGAAAQSGGPVKIGVLNDMSGSMPISAARARSRRRRWRWRISAAKCWASRSRSSPADHQNKPDIGSTIARQWFDQEGVDVIIDVPTSSVALAVNEVSREKKKIVAVVRPRLLRPYRPSARRPRALDLRHLCAGPRHRAAPW